MESRYQVRELVRLRVEDIDYSGNAAMFVLVQHLAKSPAERRFIASIARGEDCA